MRRLITRRKVIATALTALGGASGLAVAARLADRYGLIPPDHGGIYGVGETLTYASQRLLTARGSMAREFRPDQISKIAPVNGEPPTVVDYQQLLRRGFTNWRLDIDGLVERPSSLSLADLHQFPMSRQITHQACEEGWSFIAEWIGVPLASVLHHVGVGSGARYVVFYAFDDDWESLDMADAWHPQTLLAYGMNGGELPAPHGAPLRLRVPRQLGYKSIKYLAQISVVDSLKDVGDGTGSSAPGVGYSWYAGI